MAAIDVRRPLGRRLADQRLALAVLVAGLVLTGVAVSALAANVAHHRRTELDGSAVQARTAIQRRVASYAEPLYGMSAVVGGPAPADRAGFHRFVALAGTARRQPGLQAYTFNRLVPADRVAAFEATVRADTSLVPEGYPGFRVHPDVAPGTDRMVIDFVEPAAGNESILGFDVASDPRRRLAVESARDTGRLVATSPVSLVQEGTGLGFLLYLPVYATAEPPLTAPARRRHFSGVVTAAVRLDEMLAGVLGAVATERPRTRVQIREIGPTLGSRPATEGTGTLLFDSAGPGEGDRPPPGGSRSADLSVGGRRWRVFAATAPGLGQDQAALVPWFAGAGGVVLSGLLAGLLASMAGSKRRAMALAAEMTTSLRRQEDELRTANLHLAESNAALARADQAKDAFLGTMSHELRTPLTAILGFARLLEGRWDRLDAEERQESLSRIVRSAVTLNGLVDDLLEFNRTGENAPALVLEDVDLAVLSGEIVDGLGPLTTTHHLRLEAGEAPVRADRMAVARILTNLVTNAVKFAPEGTTISVTTRVADGAAVLEVADEGPGVPPDQRQLVFERFYRAAQPGQPRRPGTGIGLAVVKDLAERQGGSATITDAVSGGALFRIELPAAPGPVNGGARAGAGDGSPGREGAA